MQDAGLAAADGAGDAAALADQVLSAVVSTSVVLGVIGNDSIVMPAFTTVDTTRLTDGFVNHSFRCVFDASRGNTGASAAWRTRRTAWRLWWCATRAMALAAARRLRV